MDPRIVMVRRRTDYESLLLEHGTPQMAEFRLQGRGIALGPLHKQHRVVISASERVLGQVPTTWRKTWVLREDLDRFRFEPDDIVVGVGLDGLVPNVAKYLHGQPVIGINPFAFPQKMMHFRPDQVLSLYQDRSYSLERRVMVEAEIEDGGKIVALNELFVGHCTHQSARYDLRAAGQEEHQSSSGIIITTGTGATGWASSIAGATGLAPTELPEPTADWGYYLVREAWPSSFTGTSLVRGRVGHEESQSLRVTSKMQEGGRIFGDGIESDHLGFAWGQTAVVRISDRALNLAVPPAPKS